MRGTPEGNLHHKMDLTEEINWIYCLVKDKLVSLRTNANNRS